MLLDRDRLWPLSLVALAGATFDTWQQAPAGGSAALPLDGATAAALLPVALVGLAKWALLLGCVVGGVQWAMPLVLGRVFTGKPQEPVQLFVPVHHRRLPAASQQEGRTCCDLLW